jgi:hypothetical protein
MQNYTLQSVISQLNGMKSDFYTVGACNFGTEEMINHNHINEKQVLNLVNWLKYKNLNDYNIFIQPSSKINRALILIDDIKDNTIINLKSRGLCPACVVETSPSNFQAWVSFGDEPMPANHRAFLSKVLMKEFGGDPGSVGANHYGRLSGFTNRKTKYCKNNLYPFVICHEATGKHVENSQKIRDWVANQILSNDVKNIKSNDVKNIKSNDKIIIKEYTNTKEFVFKKYYSQYVEKVTLYNNQLDLSKADFAIVCRMIKEGFTRNQIIIDFKNNSDDLFNRKGKYTDDYINRTIDAAARRCGVTPQT